MRIAFVTCSAMPEGDPDDHGPAALLGATFHAWDDPTVDWSSFDRVVLRSPWDYTDRVVDFVAWCRGVGATRLRNAPELIAFNVDKRYLAELPVPTVPTTFLGPGDALPDFGADRPGEVVVKPNVSGGSRDTGRFSPATAGEAQALVDGITASGRTALVQPYQGRVDTRGERALVYFGGEFSHALRKGAILRPDEVAPLQEGNALGVAAAMFDKALVGPAVAEPAELDLAATLLAWVADRFDGPPLYARVDLVAGDDGAPVVMELEVVEPSLYLMHGDGSAARFAAAVRRS
ncbi:MAG: hypothetical protein AAGC46_15295 [Solirubrobacteraceae bacterium]|nr:hypothetical protein [Patulibacter sp.]